MILGGFLFFFGLSCGVSSLTLVCVALSLLALSLSLSWSVSLNSDTYKREATKYEKRPPPIVQWSMIGIIGAIIPACNPRTTVIESDPIHRLSGVSQSVALKLLRFNLKTVKQLAELDDKDLKLVVLKSEFINKKRLVGFRKTAVQALSYRSKAMNDRRGLPKAKNKNKERKKQIVKKFGTKSGAVEMVKM